MRGSRRDLPIALEGAGTTSHQADWGELSVALESFLAGTDLSGHLRGLPGDRCPCPHWGYVLKGRFRVRYAGREEVVSAGDAYYLAPGHVPIFDEDTDVVQFSPREAYQEVYEVVARNVGERDAGNRVDMESRRPPVGRSRGTRRSGREAPADTRDETEG